MRSFLYATYCIASLLASILAGASHIESHRNFGEPAYICELNNRQINESSGIAPCYLSPGQYFTHNDSGDSARFFRFNSKGQVLATYALAGAKNVDWEDMATARINGKSYVYLGDIGDNRRHRKTITVYRLPEPSGVSKSINVYEKYDLRYPDKAHNAETLLVDPKSGDLVIVTKVEGRPAQVFYLQRPSRSGAFVLMEIGKLAIGGASQDSQLATGGSVSPDGKHVVVRTYFGAYEYDARKSFKSWWKSSPIAMKTPPDLQGEGICYSADGKSLLTSAEGVPCHIGRILIN